MFNVLLQVLDDGRLTDGQGRTVDFRNTVIIMTSNLGSQVIQECRRGELPAHEDRGHGDRAAAVPAGVHQPRRRHRGVPSAGHASRSAQIVDIQLGRLRRRLLERKSSSILRRAARDQIGEAGFDPVYGARPLKRAIQQQIENPLAQRLLRSDFVPGD